MWKFQILVQKDATWPEKKNAYTRTKIESTLIFEID